MSAGVNLSKREDNFASDEERAFFMKDEPWGFVMFARDFDTPDKLDALTQSFRECVVRSQQSYASPAQTSQETEPVSDSDLFSDPADEVALQNGFAPADSDELYGANGHSSNRQSRNLESDERPERRNSYAPVAEAAAAFSSSVDGSFGYAPKQVEPEDVQPSPQSPSVDRGFIDELSFMLEEMDDEPVETVKKPLPLEPDVRLTKRDKTNNEPSTASVDPSANISLDDAFSNLTEPAVKPTGDNVDVPETGQSFAPFEPMMDIVVTDEFDYAEQLSSDFDALVAETKEKKAGKKKIAVFTSGISQKLGRSGAFAAAMLLLAVLGVGAGLGWNALVSGSQADGSLEAQLTPQTDDPAKSVVASAGEPGSAKSDERVASAARSGANAAGTVGDDGEFIITTTVEPGITIARIETPSSSPDTAATSGSTVTKASAEAAVNSAFPRLSERFALSDGEAEPNLTKPSNTGPQPEFVVEPPKIPSVPVPSDTKTASERPAETARVQDTEKPVSAPVPAKPVVATQPKKAAPRTSTASRRPIRRVTTPKRRASRAPVTNRRSPYSVQISSLRSAAEARRTYAALSRRYADVIGGKGVDIRRANVAGKGTYYRVRIPARSRSDAASLCAQLKSQGADCFVAR